MAIGIAAMVVILASIPLLGLIGSSQGKPAEDTEDSGFTLEKHEDAESEQTSATVCVYVSGEVEHPGICYLPEGSRVADAIEASGGVTSSSSIDHVNLARVIEDGEHIAIPSIEETALRSDEQGAATSAGSTYGYTEDFAYKDAGRNGSQITSGSFGGKVNINTASSTELQTLSGIGASKAQKIISYREANGPFKSIEDLTPVSGIGEKTLESIKDEICV